MKKISRIFIALFICFSSHSIASTSITTSYVSGHWSLTGSPYLIYNDIYVDDNQTLIIDPGVEIIFQGMYSMHVFGSLLAAGTFAQQINFHVQDTVGWGDTTLSGGWEGIYFDIFTATTIDSSALSYCNISDMKNGEITLFGRGLKIKNCTFFHNKNGIITQNEALGEEFELDSCEIYNNIECGITVIDYDGGNSFIHNCSIHNNGHSLGVVNAPRANLLFLNNDVYENIQFGILGGVGTLTIAGDSVTIKNNKIHNNSNENDAAIFCGRGYVDINGNLICNNQHSTAAFCAAVDGGGGINLTGFDSNTLYIVRNNIIANNYSPMHGSAISVFHAKAIITNNQVVNNTLWTDAGVFMGSIFIANTSQSAIIKNNIFYNINDTFSGNVIPNITIGTTGYIEYDHNWTQNPYSLDVVDLGAGSIYAFTLIGDTATNVIGISPGLISNTLTDSVNESALSHNFGLLPTSACINAGDSTNADCDSTDIIGNARIFGGIIDIGAYEYVPPQITTTVPSAKTVEKSIEVYPNPTQNEIYFLSESVIISYRLLSLTGACLLKGNLQLQNNSIAIDKLTSGIYILELTDVFGEKKRASIIKE